MADARPSGLALWLAGARPKTLPAAVVPVLVGTASVADEPTIWWRAIAAMVVAVALQVATNYANDYSDGIRGTDDDRVGPLRLVGSGLASPVAVKRAVIASFGVAAVVGLGLAIAVTPWLLLVGAASIAAGWFYTGGKNPYGYLGLGEVFVFVFFGLVATVGSAFVQTEAIDWRAVVFAVPVGIFATALLVINNLRDRVGDGDSGKITLAVRLGDQRTRQLYVLAMLAAFAIVVVMAIVDVPWVALGLVGLLSAIPAIRIVRAGAIGRELIAVLEGTARTQLIAGIGIAIGLAASLA